MRFRKRKSRSRSLAIAAGCGLLASLLFLYFVRPIGLIHGTVMFFYKYPLIWKLPIVAGGAVFVLTGLIPHLLRRRKARASLAEDHRPRRRSWYAGPAILAAIAAFVALVFAACTVSMYTGRAIYEHYEFTDINQLPTNGKARILPQEVAEQLATSGYNSPTSRLDQGHIVLSADGNISWTFGEVPNGTWRKYTAKTQGVATLNAESTARELELTEREFEISTDVRWTDNLSWQAYKKHFLTEVAETVYVVTPSGEPLIIAPYLKYVGFWVKVPELAGVYVVHPDGTMEDLSPREAEKRPFIAQTGRMFPVNLARRIQESYQYKGGILNRLFTHKDQTQIADTGSNAQPYLMDFGEEGTKWVSTAQPYGKAQATNAIFLTDTITGETEIWHVPKNEAYTGNSKALDIVRALSMPGVTFAASDAADAAGKFEAVEPRPVIVDGQLQFMISVIPNSATTVTKTVIVDAESNKAVAVFNHDTDPNADQRLKDYLHDGTLSTAAPSDDAYRGGSVPAGDRDSTPNVPNFVPGADGSLTDDELQAIVEDLLKSNVAQRHAILELRRELGKR